MSVSATNLAYQGIQSGFKQLADNTQQLNPNSSPSAASLENLENSDKQAIKTPSELSLEEMLLDNNRTQTQIESLAKVIKTEDKLIGQLFEDWA